MTQEITDEFINQIGGDLITTKAVDSMPVPLEPSLFNTYFIYFIIFFIITLLIAIGLFKLNKNWKEKNPWIAFIPFINIWSLFQASQKPFLEYFIYPLIALIVGYFTHGIIFALACIFSFFMWVKLLDAIAIRAKKGIWITVGLVFIPFIIFPYLAYKTNKK